MKTNHEDLLSSLFQLHVDLEFLHLTTKVYSQHMALGSTYDAFGGFKDSISEKLIAYYGRDFKLNISSPTNTVATICDALYSFAEELSKDEHTEFKNVSDEIKALSAQLRYLLTLIH